MAIKAWAIAGCIGTNYSLVWVASELSLTRLTREDSAKRRIVSARLAAVLLVTASCCICEFKKARV